MATKRIGDLPYVPTPVSTDQIEHSRAGAGSAFRTWADYLAAIGATEVPASRSLVATAPLRIDGGASGDLSANRTLSLASEAANTVIAGPVSGGSAAPTARALVAADLPTHPHAAADITSGVLSIARLATGSPDGTKFIRDDGALAVPSGIGAPASASYVTMAAESGLSAETALGAGVVMKGTLASRPAAATAGRLYYVTDSGSARWTRDTGSAWEDCPPDWTQVLNRPSTFAPSGSASGDLGSTYPNPQVVATHLASALPVAQGGTGVSTLAPHGVVLGNGTSPVAVTGAGTAGQALISGGASADPAFGAHGSAAHSGNIFPSSPANQTIGAAYVDVAETGSPSNPSTGTRRLYVDSTSHEVSVRTSGGAVVSLESGAPAAHAASHKNGGSDEVAQATPAANAIPKANAGGTLQDGWLPPTVARVLYKPADETVNNSATLQQDDNLFLNLAAGTVYSFTFVVHINDNSSAGTGGFKAALGGSATFVNLIAQATLMLNTNLAYIDVQRWTAAGQTVNVLGTDPVLELEIRGVAEVNTAGTFFLQWAQSTATGAGAGVSVLRGSSLTYQVAP